MDEHPLADPDGLDHRVGHVTEPLPAESLGSPLDHALIVPLSSARGRRIECIVQRDARRPCRADAFRSRDRPAGWALYDFANTIFSFAVVSGAIGLWLTDAAQFGERDGNFLLSIGIVASVGLNAIVSPALGALSDRAGRRLPFLFFFTALCVVPTALIASAGGVAGLLLFVVANFAYQAALVYYDSTLAIVSYPATRGRLSASAWPSATSGRSRSAC